MHRPSHEKDLAQQVTTIHLSACIAQAGVGKSVIRGEKTAKAKKYSLTGK
jgi:hypothetical protein